MTAPTNTEDRTRPPLFRCAHCGTYCLGRDRYCPGCGADTGTGDSSCSDLGVALDPTPLYCVHCGGELKNGGNKKNSRVTGQTSGRDRAGSS